MAPGPGEGSIISIADTHLIGLWLQLFFTGAYYVYVPRCVTILRLKVQNGFSVWLPAVCGVFFVLATVAVVGDMVRGYQAFSVPEEPGALPNPAYYFRDSATPLALTKNSINVICAIVSDAVIVYRTWAVWDRKYLVAAVPFLTFLADAALGLLSIYTLSQTSTGGPPVLDEVSTRVKYFFVLTFAVNATCASLICYKVWRVSRRSAAMCRWNNPRPLSNVVNVMIETGTSSGFYCAYLLVIIVANWIGSNFFFVFLDPIAPIVAIVFSMLIVRLQAPREHRLTDITSDTIRFATVSGQTVKQHSTSSTVPGVDHTGDPHLEISPRDSVGSAALQV